MSAFAGCTDLQESPLPEKGDGEERVPNIVVFFADDLGYADVGYQGCSDVPTPHIDSIARSGMRFSAGYVTAPVCGPSRAGLLTSRYQQRFGFEDNPGPFRRSPEVCVGIPEEERNLAERLKEKGYATALVGKWHGGDDEKRQPHRRGFDFYFGFNNGAALYFIGENPKGRLVRDGKPVEREDEYLTDAFGREAVRFIRDNRERPFFLYLSFNAVHGPLQAVKKEIEAFSSIVDENRRTMAAMLASMDRNIGRVMDALRSCGLENDTLVFFTSDNGGKPGGNASRNDPLRGEKGQLLEGGIRVPFCVQWKGRIAPGRGSDAMVSTLDIGATALAAAGLDPGGERPLDGANLLPLLEGKSEEPPHEHLFWRFLSQWAVRDADWKLVKWKAIDTPRLYNLSKDLCESRDVSADHPEVVRRLRSRFEEWEKELMPPRFGWQPQYCGKYRDPPRPK